MADTSFALAAHPWPGLLVVVEGAPPADTTALVDELAVTSPVPPVVVRWNNDLRVAYEYTIVPALRAGRVVLCDRYVYTIWVRDRLRGQPPALGAGSGAQFVRPDLVLYLSGEGATGADRQQELYHDLAIGPGFVHSGHREVYREVVCGHSHPVPPASVARTGPPLPVDAADLPAISRAALRRPHEVDTGATLVGALAVTARSHPDRVAVEHGGVQLTYGELAGRVGLIRAWLAATGCRPADVVAVAGRRCPDIIATFLALDGIGAVYLPVDPTWPQERLTAVLHRAGAARVVVTGPAGAAGVEVGTAAAAAGCPVSALDEIPGGPPVQEPVRQRIDRPDEIRYLIYTSGTTGLPKGAAVEHRGMVNHLWAKVIDLGLSATDALAFTAPLSFDISIWQMLAPLLVGGRVVVLDDAEQAVPTRLCGVLRRREVTVAEFVPTVVGWLVDGLRRGGGLPALRWLLSTGEELLPALAGRVLDTLPHVRLLNAYGPTECSDDVTHHEVERRDLDGPRLPIGIPIVNATLYVLVRDGGTWRAAPEDCVGELFVGGVPVGAGYPDDPAATDAAFYLDVLDPDSPTGRLYRTGDAAKVRDGRVYCLGRLDRQVKVSGVRMELAEIEAVISRHSAVRACAVAVESNGGHPELAAYCVLTAGAVPETELRELLNATLPAAMVPRRWHRLDALPLTANGKVDHSALKPEDT